MGAADGGQCDFHGGGDRNGTGTAGAGVIVVVHRRHELVISYDLAQLGNSRGSTRGFRYHWRREKISRSNYG